MKAAFVIAALLVVGSNALFLDSVSNVVDTLSSIKEAGKALISGALAKGKELLSSAVSTVLQGGATLAEKTGLLDAIGKRAVADVFAAVKASADGLKEKLKGHGANLMAKFAGAMDKLKSIFMGIHRKLTSAADADKAVDAVVADATAAMDDTKRQWKRDLSRRDVLSDIQDFFTPHIATLKDTVSGVGEQLKGHATNLVNAVKDSVFSLGSKLSGHLDSVKQHGSDLLNHGQNAFNALKDAVKDILNQTVQNAKPAVTGLINTGVDATGVIASHVADAVSGN